jgi:hypothetical protein
LRPVAPEEMTLPKKLKGKKINAAGFQQLIREHVESRKKNEEVWFWGIRY